MIIMVNDKLIVDKLLIIDDNGMPKPPTVRQLLDRDIRELYSRDKSKGKTRYVQEAIVIYYLGDPKSPARQSGLSDAEALKMAIEQAGLPTNYVPDVLVLKLIKRYYEENITEAGRVVENIIKGIHNINLVITTINNLLNSKLNSPDSITTDSIGDILNLVDSVNKKAAELPLTLKRLEEAKENLMYEKEAETARGGGAVTSSMDASDY